MSYELLILRRAQKELAGLAKVDYERMQDTIAALADRFFVKKLTGRGGWRIRAGEYQAIYKIDDAKKQVIVLHVGHRRDVYS